MLATVLNIPVVTEMVGEIAVKMLKSSDSIVANTQMDFIACCRLPFINRIINFKNIKIATRYSIKLGLIFSIVTSLIFIVFSNQIAFLFSYSANSSSLAPTISYILNFVWLFIIPVAFGATASYAFQGMGKGITSFLLTMQREAILVIIFTFILGISLSLGVRGVYYGLIIGNAIGSAVGLLCIEIFIKRLFQKFV